MAWPDPSYSRGDSPYHICARKPRVWRVRHSGSFWVQTTQQRPRDQRYHQEITTTVTTPGDHQDTPGDHQDTVPRTRIIRRLANHRLCDQDEDIRRPLGQHHETTIMLPLWEQETYGDRLREEPPTSFPPSTVAIKGIGKQTVVHDSWPRECASHECSANLTMSSRRVHHATEDDGRHEHPW